MFRPSIWLFGISLLVSVGSTATARSTHHGKTQPPAASTPRKTPAPSDEKPVAGAASPSPAEV